MQYPLELPVTERLRGPRPPPSRHNRASVVTDHSFQVYPTFCIVASRGLPAPLLPLDAERRRMILWNAHLFRVARVSFFSLHRPQRTLILLDSSLDCGWSPAAAKASNNHRLVPSAATQTRATNQPRPSHAVA
jgi:hypothetical protein